MKGLTYKVQPIQDLAIHQKTTCLVESGNLIWPWLMQFFLVYSLAYKPVELREEMLYLIGIQ